MSQRSVRRRSSRRAALIAALALAAAPVALTGAAQAPMAVTVSATSTAAAETALPTATTAAETTPATETTVGIETTTATTAAAGCTVTGGTLTWGFKESFRSYISGTIAKGSWEPIGGATYETPNFGWSGATGAFDPATLAGDVHFPGGVHFTGHNGLLDTTIANPTLRFAGDGSGVLLLDLTSLSMDDAMAGNTENVQTLTQVPMVSLDLASAPLQKSADEVTVVGTAVPTAITAEGYAAFGSYEAGSAFDPATFSFTVECPEPEPEPTPTPEPTAEPSVDAAPTPVAASSDEPADLTWVPWIGVAVVAAAITWAFVAGRRPRADGSSPRGADGSSPRGSDGSSTRGTDGTNRDGAE